MSKAAIKVRMENSFPVTILLRLRVSVCRNSAVWLLSSLDSAEMPISEANIPPPSAKMVPISVPKKPSSVVIASLSIPNAAEKPPMEANASDISAMESSIIGKRNIQPADIASTPTSQITKLMRFNFSSCLYKVIF